MAGCVGSEVTIGAEAGFVVGAASGFGAFKNGMKFTFPRVKSFLKSWIDWFIA